MDLSLFWYLLRRSLHHCEVPASLSDKGPSEHCKTWKETAKRLSATVQRHGSAKNLGHQLYVTYMFTSCTNSCRVFSSQIGSSSFFCLDRQELKWSLPFMRIFILIVYRWKNYSVIHDAWLQRWFPWMLGTVCVLDLFPAICKPSDSIRYLHDHSKPVVGACHPYQQLRMKPHTML